MAEKAMVMEPLSREMIDAGRELTQRLDQHNMPVSTALWLYLAESELWRLVIASSVVKNSGPRKAYQLIQSELRASPDEFQVISLSDISAVEPKSPLVSPFRGLSKVTAPPIEKKLMRSLFNGVFVQGAYIYKLP